MEKQLHVSGLICLVFPAYCGNSHNVLKALYLFVSVPVLAGASLGGVGSVGVVLLVLGLSSFT